MMGEYWKLCKILRGRTIAYKRKNMSQNLLPNSTAGDGESPLYSSKAGRKNTSKLTAQVLEIHRKLKSFSA